MYFNVIRDLLYIYSYYYLLLSLLLFEKVAPDVLANHKARKSFNNDKLFAGPKAWYIYSRAEYTDHFHIPNVFYFSCYRLCPPNFDYGNLKGMNTDLSALFY